MAGPGIVTVMHAMRLDRDVVVFALSAIFFSYSIAQITSMTAFDLFTLERVTQGLIALVPVIVGTWLGIRLGRRIHVRTFNICVFVLLSAMALTLGYDGLVGLRL